MLETCQNREREKTFLDPLARPIERLIYKLKHFLRELWYYLRRNPTKVFFLVIMPLISGGALAQEPCRALSIRSPWQSSGMASSC